MTREATLLFTLIFAACGGDKAGQDIVPCQGGLVAGDLAITEIMGNPTGSDVGLEWFEFYNTTGKTLNLEGVRIEVSRIDLDSLKTTRIGRFEIESAAYGVAGDVTSDFAPAHVDIGYEADLGSLRNSDGRIALYCEDVLIDEVTYDEVPDGASRAFNGRETPDADKNDDDSLWCESVDSFDETDNFGTPGAANVECAIVTPGKCMENGQQRDINYPTEGELVITELMPDPKKVGDNEGEWFEVYVPRAIDLNELQLGEDPADGAEETILAEDCISVDAGYIVFARSDDVNVNGGLMQVDRVFTEFTMNNDMGSTTPSLYIGLGGDVLDRVTWESSDAGVSLSLDKNKTDATENDTATNFCDGVDAIDPNAGDSDFGTPGAENAVCPVVVAPGMCLDNGVPRAIVYPTSGQLLVNEFLANPDGTDSDKEWIELRATATFDLNETGWSRGPAATMAEEEFALVGGDECVTLNDGDLVLMAETTVIANNGGLMMVDGIMTDVLNASGANTVLTLWADGMAIDTYDYGAAGSAAVQAGESWGFDGTTWCENDTDEYGGVGTGNYGTPRTANPTCP